MGGLAGQSVDSGIGLRHHQLRLRLFGQGFIAQGGKARRHGLVLVLALLGQEFSVFGVFLRLKKAAGCGQACGNIHDVIFQGSNWRLPPASVGTVGSCWNGDRPGVRDLLKALMPWLTNWPICAPWVLAAAKPFWARWLLVVAAWANPATGLGG